MSKVDFYYRKFILTKFFTRGWGSIPYLNKIVDYRRNHVGNRESCLKLVPNDYKIFIDREVKFNDHVLLEGHFITPLADGLGDYMPEEVKKAKFQIMIPNKWNKTELGVKNFKPICIHLAGTGDHYFWRRRTLVAKPLLSEYGIGSIILENPYYGVRKPKEQMRSSLRYVADLYMMGAGLVTESVVLMRWCESLGFGPFVLTGLSMGGHMACLAASVWPKPVALVPCLSWTTASTVFTRGVMAEAIPWKALETQFYEDRLYKTLKEKIETYNQTIPREPLFSSTELNADVEFEHTNGLAYLTLINKNFNSKKVFLTNYNIKVESSKTNREVIEFMQLLMDECTHLLNFDKPIDMNLVHVLTAKHDAYILRDGTHSFTTIWPGSQIEYLDQGHVGAFLFALNKYKETIKKTLDRSIEKHYVNDKYKTGAS